MVGIGATPPGNSPQQHTSLASRSRSRSRNKWLPLSQAEQQARAAAKGSSLLEPWREHATLRACAIGCSSPSTAGTCSMHPTAPAAAAVYLPPGLKEPDGYYRNRIENARPSGFFRDALRTYAGMLSFLDWLALPPTLQRVIGDVDGRGTDLGVFLFIADLLVLRDGGCLILRAAARSTAGHRKGTGWRPSRRGDRALAAAALRWCRAATCSIGTCPTPTARRTGSGGGRTAAARSPRTISAPCPSIYLGPDGQPLEPARSRGLALPPAPARSMTACASQRFAAVPSSSAAQRLHAEPSGARAQLVGQLSRIPACLVRRRWRRLWRGRSAPPGPGQPVPHPLPAQERIRGPPLPLRPAGGRAHGPGGSVRLPAQRGRRTPAPEQLVLSTNTFMDLPEGADFNWKEIRARSLAEHRAYLTLLDETMRRDALVPTQNRGAGRSETEISAHRRPGLRAAPVARHPEDLGVLQRAGALVLAHRRQPGARRRRLADRDAADPAGCGPSRPWASG